MFIHLGRCVAYVYPPRQEPKYVGDKGGQRPQEGDVIDKHQK